MARNDEPGMGKPKGSSGGKTSKYGAARPGGVGAAVQLDTDSARDTVAAINAVLDAGDAIMFARTSGGGILAVTLYSQGCDPVKFYAKDAEEAQVILADVENTARG